MCGALLAAAIVANQSAVHWRSNIVDDLLFAYFGWCVSDGARPYVNIWDNKPPGIWWLNAAAFRLCGPGPEAELLLGCAALLVSLTAFVGAARTVFHRSLLLPAAAAGAVLLTHLQFECGGNRTETYVVTCETLAILGYLRWLRRGQMRWLILGGLAAGAAPLFKQAGLAAAGAAALHLAWLQWYRRHDPRGHPWQRGWRPWLIGGATFATLPALAVIVLAAQGALAEAAFAVGRFNRAYFAINDATWLEIGRALQIYTPVWRALGPLLVVASIGLLAGLAPRRRHTLTPRAARPPQPRRGVGTLVLWFLLAAYLACVGPGRRGHHFMPALPALGLLALYVIHLIGRRRGLRTVLTVRPSATAALVMWLYLLAVLAAGSWNAALSMWRTKPHWYALQRLQPEPYEAQAALIRQLTRPNDTIYVWGWSPGTYRCSYRRPASRYATIEKRGQVGEHAQFIVDGAVHEIQQRPPRIFVISSGDYAAAITPPCTDFAAWLQANYRLRATIEGMHILLQQDNPPFTP